MTASGTKWTCDSFQSMSAFGGKADMRPLSATGLGALGVTELFACKRGLAATIHENSCRNCFASTERPQIIVGMLAPTSGAIRGRERDRGRALLGMRAAPILRLRPRPTSSTFRDPARATSGRGWLTLWSNFNCLTKRDKDPLARNVLWRCGSFQE
jgi:hypothetical protein